VKKGLSIERRAGYCTLRRGAVENDTNERGSKRKAKEARSPH